MPFVRISLVKGKPAPYVRAIADGVHQALIEAFHIPVDDRFQVIHQVEPGDLIYDPQYLGVKRTDDVVIVNITAGKWRDLAAKKLLYRRTAELLAENPGVRPEDVQVILSGNDREDWSFGNGVSSYVKD